jgi:uncharacterized tellurite resistance protein B-like protein
MGFVGVLLAFAAGLGIWMYRARNAADAAQGVFDMAKDAKSAARRFGYLRKKNKSPLDTVDDPRLSAAGMMVAVAKLDGDLSREQIEQITRECIETFEVDAAEAADMTALGRWLSQHGEPEEVMRRLARGLRGQMDADQSSSLYEMMERVAVVEGGEASERQNQAFDMIRRTLG